MELELQKKLLDTHKMYQYLKENFIEEPSCLETLLPHIDNPNVLEEFLNIKKQRKEIILTKKNKSNRNKKSY